MNAFTFNSNLWSSATLEDLFEDDEEQVEGEGKGEAEGVEEEHVQVF